MTDHLSSYKRFLRSKKGYSGIIATIFMVLVVMYLYYNVFIFVQNQNVSFQDVTSQSQQLDADRNSEHVSFSDVVCTHGIGNNYIVAFTVSNTGPIPVQLIRIWGADSENEYTSQKLSIVLQPGAKSSETIVFNLGGSMSDIVMWVVTARGNLVSTSTKVA